MAYAEKLVKSWRACWSVPGKKSPEKLSGFATEREAKRHAQEKEVEARRHGLARTDGSRMLFSDWAQEWYDALSLEPSSMENYRSIVENHLLPRWGHLTMREIERADAAITAWANTYEGKYTHGSIERIVGQMRRMCVDAYDAGIIGRVPLAPRRSRGRIAPKRAARQAVRYSNITDALGAFLIAERCASLSGRDDEFIMVAAKYWMGLRWSELMGLEKVMVSSQIDLEFQLYQMPGKKFYRKTPKDGSRRLIDIPPSVRDLLVRQSRTVAHPDTDAQWCPCGDGLDEVYRHEPGIHVFAGREGERHMLTNTFRGQVFLPAARGLYYAGEKQERPVLQVERSDGTPPGVFDAVPAGRGQRRPENPLSCWAPICPGMKPHGMRHSHRALLEELGTPKVLMDDRLGHADHSVSARYSHVTPTMREQLVGRLEQAWSEALEARRELGWESPVAVVRELLGQDPAGSHSRFTPDKGSRLRVPGRGKVA